MDISAGQGYHSNPGYAGMMTCMVQILSRMLYGTVSSPARSDFQFDLFGLSPLGSIILQEMAKYNRDYGDYQLFHGIRLVLRYATEELQRLYVLPNSRARYDSNGK